MLALPDLPYAHDALDPIVSAQTLKIHHGKHHRAYVDKTNALARDTEVASAPLERIIQWAAPRRAADKAAAALFNNAAQAWNHEFYWQSLRPRGSTPPEGPLAALIASEFGSHDRFAQAYIAAAVNHFGSGWAWLVIDGTALKIVTTSNADTPLVGGQAPLLVIDVWEHAYYLDHQERRAAYVTAVVNELLDWRFARRNFAQAIRRVDGEVGAAAAAVQ